MKYSYQSVKEKSSDLEFQANRFQHSESLCQLILEHIKVGTFSLNSTQNPFEVLIILCERLRAMDAQRPLNSKWEATLTNYILCSQDSVFKLETYQLEKHECDLMDLEKSLVFKLQKQTNSVRGRERGNGSSSDSRNIKLFSGIEIEGHDYIEAVLEKSSEKHSRQGDSYKKTSLSKIRLRVDKLTKCITSTYIKDDHYINLDDFVLNIGGQQHATYSQTSTSESTPSMHEDCQYILQALSNNLAMLSSRETQVNGLYYVDGKPWTDEHLFMATKVRQNPVQAKTYESNIERLPLSATHTISITPANTIAYYCYKFNKDGISMLDYNQGAIQGAVYNRGPLLTDVTSSEPQVSSNVLPVVGVVLPGTSEASLDKAQEEQKVSSSWLLAAIYNPSSYICLVMALSAAMLIAGMVTNSPNLLISSGVLCGVAILGIFTAAAKENSLTEKSVVEPKKSS